MKRTKRIQKLVMLIPLLLIVCFVIFPYIWTFLTSIKPTDELYTTSVKILPREMAFQNYVALFTSTDFFASMSHSIVIAVVTSCISMPALSMVPYAFAKYRLRGKSLALSGILLLHMFPSVLHLTPLFVVFNELKFIGSLAVLVASYHAFTVPFSIQFLTPHMKSIPLELEEVGRTDGVNVPQLLYYVVMPLLKPGLVAIDTYMFINFWNEYLFAVMFTTSNNRTLPASLASLVGEYDLRWDIISVGAVAAIILVVILFVFIQKSPVAGLTAGSVKGQR